jgi:hypothetical protein
MPRVRSVKQKVAAVAAVAVVLAGGSYAAMAATGQSSGHKGKHAHAAKSDLGVSAAYLGVSRSELASDLQSGRTLAQVANATSGKSAEGLLEALVSAKKSKLAGAVETLTQRVTAEINRAGGPASGAGAAKRTRARRGAPGLLGSAASYLGLTRKQLRAQLQSGTSLAQLASSTPGRSPAGLIDALSQAKKARMAQLVSAGKLTKAKQATRLERLTKRMTRVSKRKFAKHASA